MPPSSYLRYLPPVLWETEAGDLPLGQFLSIFEKVLTGLDDGVPLPAVVPGTDMSAASGADDGSGGAAADGAVAGGTTVGGAALPAEQRALTSTIDGLHDLFDPWRTPEAFLPWLASWVALEFPTHPVGDGGRRPLWDTYQRRKVTAEIAQLYRLRGLRDGLTRFLDLYTAIAPRPRVAVDDGSRLLSLDLRPPSSGQIISLLSRNPSAYYAPHPPPPTDQPPHQRRLILTREGPVHPRCLALPPDGSLLLGDLGTVDNWLEPPSLRGGNAASALPPAPTIPPGVWRYPSLGAATTTHPERIALTDQEGNAIAFENPIALVVDPKGLGCVYVLDRRDNAGLDTGFLLRIDLPNWSVAENLGAVLGTRWPVGMALDPDGRLVILDRGASIVSGDPVAATLLRLPPYGAPPPQRPDFPADLIPAGVEPLSLLLLEDGTVLIGDGGRQSNTSDGGLLHLTLSEGQWSALPLTIGPPDNPVNPLVAPVAMVESTAGTVLIVDLGLKPHTNGADPNDPGLAGKEFLRYRCEPAAVYQADIRADVVSVRRVSETGQLVQPTDLARVGSTLYITDLGASAPAATYFTPREWRAEPHAFGVVAHFPPEPHSTASSRQQMLRTIASIVNREKPAHTTMMYALVYDE